MRIVLPWPRRCMARAGEGNWFSASFSARVAAAESSIGEVINGPQAIAGEWGHTSLNPGGPLCFCGQRGCVETYISGGGVEARYAEQFGRKRSFKEIEK